MPDHERYMRECFALARRGTGRVSPNPRVGAVLVRGGKIVSRGWHRRFGGAHAEVECLRMYKGQMKGATLYVNLEPCAHHGKTPPCTDLILARGVPSVVVAMADPNPLVRGRGLRALRAAGVRVTAGVLEEEALQLNRDFVTHVTRSRPYVHVKIAQTMDGRIARKGGGFEWISSPPSRRLVHEWRARFDAVLVGAGTVRADDPRLNVRLARGRDPHVVILDGALSVSPKANVLTAGKRRTVFVCTSSSAVRRLQAKAAALVARGAVIIAVGGTSQRIVLDEVLQALYLQGIGSILVEGGSHVFGEFLSSGLVDELSVFVAPAFAGGGVPVVAEGSGPFAMDQLRLEMPERVGDDLLIRALRPIRP